jgi:hypothetical protein
MNSLAKLAVLSLVLVLAFGIVYIQPTNVTASDNSIQSHCGPWYTTSSSTFCEDGKKYEVREEYRRCQNEDHDGYYTQTRRTVKYVGPCPV